MNTLLYIGIVVLLNGEPLFVATKILKFIVFSCHADFVSFTEAFLQLKSSYFVKLMFIC